MKTSRRLLGFLVLAILAGPASRGFAAVPAPALAAPAPTNAARATPGPARDYAAREAADAGKLEGFQGGGSGIYIGGSTVVIVLVVVLLIILL
jgi:hypothetical protein